MTISFILHITVQYGVNPGRRQVRNMYTHSINYAKMNAYFNTSWHACS